MRGYARKLNIDCDIACDLRDVSLNDLVSSFRAPAKRDDQSRCSGKTMFRKPVNEYMV